MLSLSEISTAGATFREDLAAYTAAGFAGIGIWEMKLDNDTADAAALRQSGLKATNCVPLVPSILPNPVIEGPTRVEERIASLCASMRRFARYEPDSVLCLTGPAGALPEDEARTVVIEGLKRIADAAAGAGVRLGLEPIHASQREQLSLVTSIPEAIDLLDEAGLPQVGIMVDLWHVWDTPTIERDLRDGIDRITGVHVADWWAEPRGDRALPGEGVSRTRELAGILDRAGWHGAWDVEIFGDAERSDSIWSLGPVEAAERAYEAAVAALP
ncbi:MAG TPA: sugar phosphate isomerase/epimerase family protein [Gaiellaceae bacterium]|nr:sugar phosphate isomerase/epimerase family protein [Gaiellaceae bacterium]